MPETAPSQEEDASAVDATVARTIDEGSAEKGPTPVQGPPVVPPHPGAQSPAPERSQPLAASAQSRPTVSSTDSSKPAAGSNPFVGIAASDVVRDVLSAIASFSALGLTWNAVDDGLLKGGDNWWVIIAVLLSVASLIIPYLLRAKLLGPIGPSEARLIKLAANLPAFASILIAVIYDLAHFNDYVGGLGGGIVMLAAGAVLAAQERSIERSPSHVVGFWRLAGIVSGAAAIVVMVVTTVRYAAFEDGLWDPFLGALSLILLIAGGGLVVFVIPFLQALRNTFASLVVLAALGFTVATNELLATMGDSPSFVSSESKFNQLVFAATFLVVVSAAILSSYPILKEAKQASTTEGWIASARLALGLTAIYSALYVVSNVLGYSAVNNWGGSTITVVVLFALIGGSAAISSVLIGADASANRATVLLVTSATIVIGITALAVGHANDDVSFFWMSTCAVFSFPILAICALTIPKSVRDRFGPIYTPPVQSDTPTQY